MRELTEEQKKKFYIYKEVDEQSFPEDRVWKIWVPLAKTMPGGIWMQYPTQEEALDVALMPDAERDKMLDELFFEGGW